MDCRPALDEFGAGCPLSLGTGTFRSSLCRHRRRAAQSFLERLPSLGEGMGHLLADRHAATALHTQKFSLALDTGAENAIDEDETPCIIAARGLEVLGMVQAVMLCRVEQEPPPSRRIETDIDVLIGSGRQLQGASDQ